MTEQIDKSCKNWRPKGNQPISILVTNMPTVPKKDSRAP